MPPSLQFNFWSWSPQQWRNGMCTYPHVHTQINKNIVIFPLNEGTVEIRDTPHLSIYKQASSNYTAFLISPYRYSEQRCILKGIGVTHTPPKIANSGVEWAVGGETRNTPSPQKWQRTSEGLPPSVQYRWECSRGRREGGETPWRGTAFSSNNPELLKVNTGRRGWSWGRGWRWKRKTLCNIRTLLLF